MAQGPEPKSNLNPDPNADPNPTNWLHSVFYKHVSEFLGYKLLNFMPILDYKLLILAKNIA